MTGGRGKTELYFERKMVNILILATVFPTFRGKKIVRDCFILNWNQNIWFWLVLISEDLIPARGTFGYLVDGESPWHKFKNSGFQQSQTILLSICFDEQSSSRNAHKFFKWLSLYNGLILLGNTIGGVNKIV